MPRPRVHIKGDPIMKEKHEKALDKLRAELLAIPEAVRGDYFRRFRRHSYSARLDANDAVRDVLGRVACAQTYLLVLSGNDASNDAGKATIPVHRLLCGATSEDRESAWPLVPIREPSFVATPQGAAPAMLTVTPRLTPSPSAAANFLFRPWWRVARPRRLPVRNRHRRLDLAARRCAGRERGFLLDVHDRGGGAGVHWWLSRIAQGPRAAGALRLRPVRPATRPSQ